MSKAIGEIDVLTRRELKKWYRDPWLLVITIFQPIIWMGLFGKAFNLTGLLKIPDDLLNQLPPTVTSQFSLIFNRIMTDLFGAPGIDYFSYMAMGMVAVIVLFTSMVAGYSTAWDRRLGFLNKLIAAPIRRSSIILSKVLASVVRALVQAVLVLLIALALGLKLNPAGVLEVTTAFVALLLLALGLSSLFISLTLRVKSWESQAAIMNLLNLPLTFASNALYPTKLMPSWLQNVASVNPLSYAVDILRQALLMGTKSNLAVIRFNLLGLAVFAIGLTAIGMLVADAGLRRP